MKRRAVILILLITLLPVLLLSWAALRMAGDERLRVEQRFRDAMLQRLKDINATIARQFQSSERQLREFTAIDQFDPEYLRELCRNEPRVLQLFVLGEDGNLIYPNPAQSLNDREQTFLFKAARMITDRDLSSAVAMTENDTQRSNRVSENTNLLPSPAAESALPLAASAASKTSPSAPNEVSVAAADEQPAELEAGASSDVFSQSIPAPASTMAAPIEGEPAKTLTQEIQERSSQLSKAQQKESPVENSGWFVWYWDRGLNLIFWQRRSGGRIVGAALERARWISDLITQLPDSTMDLQTTSPGSSTELTIPTLIRLTGAEADPLYQWGTFPANEVLPDPLCEIPVSTPLSSWRLQCFVPPNALTEGTSKSTLLSLGGGVVFAGFALAVLALLLFRDYSRDMREAAQKVSFVNQVSHELKTPLTNIRLYAELLETDFDEMGTELAGNRSGSESKVRRRIAVINEEVQRLSRLIGNVLTFAQQRKTPQVPRPVPQIPDAVIDRVLERFRPSLETAGIAVRMSLNASVAVPIDGDFLEQILGNLINNVEKYASSGGVVDIRSQMEQNLLIVDVVDEGPGIEDSMRNRIFEPFARGSSSLHAPAGTGIGLSISRSLAESHGGSLTLLNRVTGCHFRMTLNAGSCDS
ncbi:MAG: sensor histidine kinase [Planctomyces sp.]